MIAPWTAPETAAFCVLAFIAWGAWMVWMLVDGGAIASMLDDDGGE